ncbi:MAG: hypothetical protein HY427_03355 [Candidatus Levybacteria bacterium]|nr:hypothetical protein [Candidatus Levybacteria bacterium]
MTHENLTPREAFDYSINRMPEVNETPTGGPGPTRGTPGRPRGGEGGREPQDARIPPTPERIAEARKAWEPIMQKTTDPAERESMRALAEMGTPPTGGAAPDINLEGITSLLIRNLGNQANEFLSAVGETPEALVEVRRNIMDATVPPEDEAERRRLLSRVNERIGQERGAQEARQEERARQMRRRERYYSDITKIKELLEDRTKRDEEFNDLFAGVDATPHEFFDRAFNPLTYGMRYEEFMDTIRKGSINGLTEDGIDLTEDQQRELTRDLQRYQIERRVRQTLHDVNAILYLPSIKAEDLYKNMQQISTELEDFAFKMPGVRQMMDLYEAALRQDMRETGGYLRPESVRGHVITEAQEDGTTITRVERGEIEEATKRQFKKIMAQNLIIVRKPGVDNRVENRVITNLQDWEIDRIFTIARGMLITNERLISLAAESRLPKEGIGRYTSLFLQDVLQSYSPYIHLLGKFGVTESGLAAYLHKDKSGKSLIDYLRMWSPKELEETLRRFEKDPLSILESTDDMFHLMRENPNRAGDIFTWLSWRADENPDVVSMTQKFLQEGRKRMERRLAQGLRPQNISEEDYRNEYSNWIGTALRFERLRGRLENLRSRDPDKRGEGEEAKTKAKEIIKQMVRLQPQRLYLVSREIRERLDSDLSPEQIQNISRILENLSLVENALLAERETLLDNGETFNTITLDNFFNVIQDPRERAEAQDFARKVFQDYTSNGELYDSEFIYKREYRHGFVLWSGDAPVDEFNVAALGPTGGSARRARDNNMQAEAAQEEIKLLASLRKVREPEEVVEVLMAIYDKISIYDPGKAKQAVFEKAEGIAKFFAADWATKVPYLGELMKLTGHASFAQTVYGRSAPVWEASETRHFFLLLKNRQLITDEQYKNLQDKVFSGNIDVIMDVGSTLAELIAVAMLLYIIQNSLKDK